MTSGEAQKQDATTRQSVPSTRFIGFDGGASAFEPVTKHSQFEVGLKSTVSYRFSDWPIRKLFCVAQMPQIEDITEQFILQLRIGYDWDRTILRIKTT